MVTSLHAIQSTTKFTIDELPVFDSSLEVIPFLQRNYFPGKFYKHSYDQFYQTLFGSDIRQHVKKLMRAGDLQKEDIWEKHQESFRIVKRARKHAEQLRSVMLLVDESHKQPKLLKRLNDAIGEFKDIVVFRPDDKDPAELYEALDRIVVSGLPPISPATYESFFEKYSSLLERVHSFYIPEDLNLKQHHKLRVIMRIFTYFYKTIAASIDFEDLSSFACYLDVAVAEMGKTQDRIYVLTHKGELDEERDRTCLNSTHRKIIGDFLKMNGKM